MGHSLKTKKVQWYGITKKLTLTSAPARLRSFMITWKMCSLMSPWLLKGAATL
uniref:Uncharacterized protein n=1 Tax=Rhizophora mucronata TaxID=61149 RepID=A0A2P2NTW7_RHIMU